MSMKLDDPTTHGWSIYDHIEEYKGKLGLKERDHRAYYESSQFNKKMNEEEISILRRNLKMKRVDLSEHTLNGDKRVIVNAFTGRKKDQLAFRRKTAETAVAEMDQKTCEKVKLLNALTYERCQKEKRVQELQAVLERSQTQADNEEDMFEKNELKSIRIIENNLEKADMKYRTAKKIQVNYKEIVKCLEEESLTFPRKLRALEKALQHQIKELEELKNINKDAHLKKDVARAELSEIEQQIMEARRSREKKLSQTKKKAEKQKEIADKVDRRARAFLQTDEAIIDPQQKAKQDESSWVRITSYDDAFQRIKDATGVSDTNEILQRFQGQNHTMDHLEKQKVSVEKQKNWLQEQKSQQQKQYEAMKYSGESNMSQGEQMLEKMHDHLKHQTERAASLKTQVDNATRTTVDVTSGIEHLYETLKDVKLKPPMRNNAFSGDSIDQLSVSTKKLINLMSMITKPKDIKIRQTTEFSEFMENRLPNENLRIRLQDTVSYPDDEFGYDSQDNEDMLTNNDIKLQAQLLMDQKKFKKRTRRGKRR
ncbi:coiled-coil domain-containing protein 151-like [Anneissia japonica]|uniref:coiled-coil domain-containing protein 151-like n=1 Tax=Anneissia japonica TaxID=1529436 RepID=UPI00142567F8|nr:coiled-coil domain-containing protein 151-like [Anneissia japonica]